MDSVHSTNNALNSLSSNDKEKSAIAAQEKNLIASKRARFYATVYRQNFVLPDSIMYYIAKTPATPELYQLLAKTCKYFFLKNPIIIYFNNTLVDGKHLKIWTTLGWKISFNLENSTSRFWITNQFTVVPEDPNQKNIVALLIPRFYQFKAKELCIVDQVITLNEYIYLSSTPVTISLQNVTIKDEIGVVVALEKLVEIPAKVQSFLSYPKTTLTNITSKTAKELFENPNFLHLKYFGLFKIPDSFDLNAFYGFMKKNKTTKIILDFDDTISNAYKNCLEAIVDEMLTTEAFDYKPTFITFPGMNGEKYDKVQRIYFKHSYKSF